MDNLPDGFELSAHLRTLQNGLCPAWTGKSAHIAIQAHEQWDHPCVYVEKTNRRSERFTQQGSPPRVRGKAAVRAGNRARAGITPAWAGKSFCASALKINTKDHPRVCGEKSTTWTLLENHEGSPPRGRGKVSYCSSSGLRMRITPAYAGKSSNRRAAGRARRDHPRVCGEKVILCHFLSSFLGSPPRMRGKGVTVDASARIDGITPAYAGKSFVVLVFRLADEDHPRVCGEKDSSGRR